MVRRTSKTLKNLVEQLFFKLSAVVLIRKDHDARVTEVAELAKMQAWCHITTLEVEEGPPYSLDSLKTERLPA